MTTGIAFILRLGLTLALSMSVSGVLAQTPTAPTKPTTTRSRGVIIVPADVADSGGGAKPDSPVKTIAPVNHSIIRNCERPNGKWDLVYSGQSEFDRNLSAALKAGKPVVVNLVEPYDDKSPPPGALGAWLSEVKGAGGQVAVSTYCASSRGIGGNWFSDFVQHLTGSVYKAARNYDATLFADETKHKITQVAFVPRPNPAGVH